MSCITCVSLLPAISLMAADRYDPMLDFTSSQISWLFRLDPHLAFTSYSVRQNKGETGSHRHKHCAVPEEKLSFCFTSYCMGNDLLMEYINPPLTPKQCLPSAREGRKRRVRGPAMAPGPVGCSGLWRPWRCQAWPCAPGLRPSLRPPLLNQKNSFFFFPPPRRDTKGEGEVRSQHQDLGFLTPWHRCQRPQRVWKISHQPRKSQKQQQQPDMAIYILQTYHIFSDETVSLITHTDSKISEL